MVEVGMLRMSKEGSAQKQNLPFFPDRSGTYLGSGTVLDRARQKKREILARKSRFWIFHDVIEKDETIDEVENVDILMRGPVFIMLVLSKKLLPKIVTKENITDKIVSVTIIKLSLK